MENKGAQRNFMSPEQQKRQKLDATEQRVEEEESPAAEQPKPQIGQKRAWNYVFPEKPKRQKSGEGPDSPDYRTTSRAQRLVFTTQKHLLPQEALDEYEDLIRPECQMRGKRNRINAIINKFTPRETNYGGRIQAKKMSVTQKYQDG